MKPNYFLFSVGSVLLLFTLLPPAQNPAERTVPSNYTIGEIKIEITPQPIVHWNGGVSEGTSIPIYKLLRIASNLTFERTYQVCVHEMCHIENNKFGNDTEEACITMETTANNIVCDRLLVLVNENKRT